LRKYMATDWAGQPDRSQGWTRSSTLPNASAHLACFGQRGGRVTLMNGRANRATYWLVVGIMAMLMVVVGVIAPGSAHISELALIFLAIPRLHDIGRKGWWVLAALGLEIGLMFVPTSSFSVLGGSIAFVIFALVALLGAIPGNVGPNRFGDPPPPGLHFYRRPRN
jgi:uncharacterized membrane protein YhaH (DUF805 family)